MQGKRIKGLIALASAVAALSTPTLAQADHTQESIFQDDNHLLYSSTTTVDHVLGVLKSLGVNRVRVTILWKALAPDPLTRTRPAGFNASDPNAYPPANWAVYDRVLTLAISHGIGVDFNVTAPGPLWAMRHDAPTTRSADHFAPSVSEFGQFVQAVGTRYSGTFAPPNGGLLPRVHYWTIWNEPNIPGWLAPQSRSFHGKQVENSPRLYREYVDAAFAALNTSTHTTRRDTILIGELAPEGYPNLGFYTAMEAMRFVRAMYCVDGSYRPLRGSRALALGCPTSGRASAFAAAHPGLFGATGFAHHPYYFLFPPGYSAPNPDFVPIADLGRLERGLDRIFRNYGSRRRLPLYLTEYGYQTKPPDPHEVVSPAHQAAYLNQADFMAYSDPRVRAVAQFLLYDDGPDIRYPKSSFSYWDTFQTGLLFANGARKPAYAAYRLPIWLPSTRVARGGRIAIWGQLRAARRGSAHTALIQWRPSHGAYRTIATVHLPASDQRAYLVAHVRIPASGAVHIAWGSQTSRAVGVTVR